jgi:hypothetical protein
MEKLHKPNLEDWFLIWIQYLIDNKYIAKFQFKHGVPSFVLYEGQRIDGVALLFPATYKPDGRIYWTKKAEGIFYTHLQKDTDLKESCYFLADRYDKEYDGFVSYCEVKAPPGYGRSNTSDAAFAIQQKWLWSSYRIYVNKVFLYPLKAVNNEKPYLWPTTFTPERYMFTDKTLTPRTIPNARKSKKDATRVAAWLPVMWEEFIKKKNP